jgi:preprotein translocase subunit YajC
LIVYVVVFIAIFYFMAIRPQQRQRRAHQELLASLKKGDRVSTAAGIYGTVKKIEDNIVHVEIARGVTMKVSRRAIVEILNKDTTEGKAALPEGSTRKGKAAVTEADETSMDEVETEAGEETETGEWDEQKPEQ